MLDVVSEEGCLPPNTKETAGKNMQEFLQNQLVFNSIRVTRTKSAGCLYCAYRSSVCSLTSRCIRQMSAAFELPMKRLVNKLTRSARPQKGKQASTLDAPFSQLLLTIRYQEPQSCSQYCQSLCQQGSAPPQHHSRQDKDCLLLPLIIFLALPSELQSRSSRSNRLKFDKADSLWNTKHIQVAHSSPSIVLNRHLTSYEGERKKKKKYPIEANFITIFLISVVYRYFIKIQLFLRETLKMR